MKVPLHEKERERERERELKDTVTIRLTTIPSCPVNFEMIL